jgi:putative oxidoreductase
MNALEATLNEWQPRILSVLRIMAGLLFMQHGLSKHFAFPIPFPNPLPLYSLLWFAGWIEIIGGFLLVIGLFSRWAAFICSGEMAFAYFIGHQPRALFPHANAGNLAILYCFVFFYLFFAGPGPWSVDAARSANETS